jgi:hypothetical protein
MSIGPSVHMNGVLSAANSIPPCEVLGEFEYRRVRWEDYNASKTVGVKPPIYSNGTVASDGWLTEIKDMRVPLYTSYPFSSAPVDAISQTPNTTASDACELTAGVWCEKINHCFSSQQELLDYVSSIGAVYDAGGITGGWYGADLTLDPSVFINFALEEPMYLCENSGGFWAGSVYIDERTMMYNERYNRDETTTILKGAHEPDWVGGRGNDRGGRTSSMIDEVDENDPSIFYCYMHRISLNSTDGTESIPPPNPAATPPETPIAGLLVTATSIFFASSVSVTVQFPYSNLPSAIATALGSSAMVKSDSDSTCASIFSMPPLIGVPTFPDINLGETICKHAGDAMNEAKIIAAAIPPAIRAAAIKAAKSFVDPILSLIGGGWDLIKSLVPSLSFSGIAIDLVDMVLNIDNPVQYILDMIYEAVGDSIDDMNAMICSIYAAIGSSYDYMSDRFRSIRKDVVDAVDSLWSWIILKVEMGFVGLMDYLGELAFIFTLPPPPNPINIAIKLVREMFASLYDGIFLKIMSGEFPGFDAMDLYQTMMDKVNVVIDSVMLQVKAIVDLVLGLERVIANLNRDKLVLERRLSEGEDVQSEIDAITILIAEKEEELANQRSLKDILLDSIKDKWNILLAEIDNIPIMSTINSFLSFIGMSVDSLLTLIDNGVNKSIAAVSSFADEVKMWCKTIFDQVSTLVVSFVTEWVNKIIKLIGAPISFPPVTIPVPTLPAICFPKPTIPDVPNIESVLD